VRLALNRHALLQRLSEPHHSGRSSKLAGPKAHEINELPLSAIPASSEFGARMRAPNGRDHNSDKQSHDA